MIYGVVSEDLGGALLMFPLAPALSVVAEDGSAPVPASLPLCFFDLDFAQRAAEQAKAEAVSGVEDWKVCFFVRLAATEHLRPVRREEGVSVQDASAH